MSLRTPWCRALGLQRPVVNAPMGGAAGGALASAVSRAGGLGMIGMGSSATPELLTVELNRLSTPELRFGIGLVHWVAAAQPGLLDVALAARPTLLSVSFGDDWAWVTRAHDAGVPVTTQVATVEAALRAVDAGVDVLVARGAEGGGHGEPRMGTLPLLTEVLDRVDVPVLAAGGIANARGLAAVLAAGAAAAWLGTVFTTTVEALTDAQARTALLAATGHSTVITSEFDRAQGYPWPPSLPERVLVDADGAPTPVNAGQGVGMVTRASAAGDLVDELCRGAQTLLEAWGG